MGKAQIPIYATSDDWQQLISALSLQRPLKLAKAGAFATPLVKNLEALSELEPLVRYLVVDESSKVFTRLVSQRSGVIRHDIDQHENAGSIMIHVGGWAGSHCLVAGRVSTGLTDTAAQELYAMFSKAIRKKFVKIKSYYVGPEALRLLDAGSRLSPTPTSPPLYDLVK